MDVSEIEFMAEQEDITIIPKFSDHRVIHLISGDVGPFRAGIPCVVPLWLAVNLRKRQRCTIVIPDWLDGDMLRLKREEENTTGVFTQMPNDHWLGIAHILFTHALEDMPNSIDVKGRLRDIWDLRDSKARNSAITFLKSGSRHAGIDHYTPLEFCNLRPILLDSLDTVNRLGQPLDPSSYLNIPLTTQSQSQSESPQPSTSHSRS